MNEIKIYEELSYIITFDDKVYPTPMKKSDLEKVLNSNLKFVDLGTDLIATSSIKRVETKKANDIDNALLRIEDKEIREQVEQKLKRRKAEGLRVNMEIFKNILDSLSQ